MRLTLPIPTPSRNEADKWHWAKRHKWTQGLQLLVRAEATACGWKTDGEPRRMRVCVVRYSAGQLDHDNLVGGCKGLIDALVREGVLHDDSPRWCEVTYEQRKAARADARTEVEISESRYGERG